MDPSALPGKARRLPFPHRRGRMRRVKPKPLYQSLTFWSGILVMGFICWAWWDSMRVISGVSRAGLVASNSAAFLAVGRMTNTVPSAVPPAPGIEFQRESLGLLHKSVVISSTPLPAFFTGGGATDALLWSPEDIIDPPPQVTYVRAFEYTMITQPHEDWLLVIPHWLILLAVAVPWSGLLLWRARRHRMAMQPLTG